MRTIRLLLAAAVVAASALVFTGSAIPAGAQTVFEVAAFPTSPGVGTEIELTLSIASSAAPTANVKMYVPAGYRANLAVPAGTKLGDGSLQLKVGAATASGDGSITADDPARHLADPCAPGQHAAVWLLSTTVSGQPVTVTLYVDGATPDIASRAAYVIQACFDAPSTGRQLSAIDLDLTKTFANPGASLTIWHAVVTPFGAGDLVNPAGALEAQAAVATPRRVSIATKYDKKHHRVTISGRATAAGKADGQVIVDIYSTTNLSKRPTRLGSVRTNGSGAYTFKHALTKTSYILVFAPELISNAGDCDPTIGPTACTNQTYSESDPSIKKVTVPKK